MASPSRNKDADALGASDALGALGIPGTLGASPAPRLLGCRFAVGFPRGRRFPADETESGQGTVEFAVITVGFIAVAAAFGALWKLFGEGKVVEHALISASHHVQMAAAGAVADILLY